MSGSIQVASTLQCCPWKKDGIFVKEMCCMSDWIELYGGGIVQK